MSERQVVRAIYCRAGRKPELVSLSPSRDGSYLSALQRKVCGRVDCIALADGVDAWVHEDGRALGLPVNRSVALPPRALPSWLDDESFIIGPDGEEMSRADAEALYANAPTTTPILGDFVLARVTPDGALASVTEEDVGRYAFLFAEEDRALAQHMERVREMLYASAGPGSWGME